MDEHETYLSPFSWRYASAEMRRIWSEQNKRLLWRRIWVALARAQSAYGLVNAEQLADLEAHANEIGISRALEIEAEIHHDLMAEVKTFAEWRIYPATPASPRSAPVNWPQKSTRR